MYDIIYNDFTTIVGLELIVPVATKRNAGVAAG